MGGLRADAHGILIPRGDEVHAQAIPCDVDVGSHLLRPVPGHPSTDREDGQTLRLQGEAREAREVQEGVEAGDGFQDLPGVVRSLSLGGFIAQVERSRPSSESVKAGT